MEILRKQLLNAYTNLQNNSSVRDNTFKHSSTSSVENTFFTFLDTMFIILSKFDSEILIICETVSIYFCINMCNICVIQF